MTTFGTITAEDMSMFDRSIRDLILQAVRSHGVTGRVSSNGHVILRAPNGETCSVSREFTKTRQGRFSVKRDLKRLTLPRTASSLDGAEVSDSQLDAVVNMIDQDIITINRVKNEVTLHPRKPRHSERKPIHVPISAAATEQDMQIEADKLLAPTFTQAPATTTLGGGKGRKVPSKTAWVRTWSDGSVDYQCMGADCNYTAEKMQAVAMHYARRADALHPSVSYDEVKTAPAPAPAIVIDNLSELFDEQVNAVVDSHKIAAIRDIIGHDPRVVELEMENAKLRDLIAKLETERDACKLQSEELVSSITALHELTGAIIPLPKVVS